MLRQGTKTKLLQVKESASSNNSCHLLLCFYQLPYAQCHTPAPNQNTTYTNTTTTMMLCSKRDGNILLKTAAPLHKKNQIRSGVPEHQWSCIYCMWKTARAAPKQSHSWRKVSEHTCDFYLKKRG